MGSTAGAVRIAPLLLSLLPGCLAGQIVAERQSRVAELSRFDSGCPSVELVEQLGDDRFKLRGCGSVFVYACQDRFRGVRTQFLDLVVTGGMDLAAPCELVSVYREPPVDRPPPRRALEWLGARRAAPSSRPVVRLPELPELPEAGEVKRAMSTLEPELRRCAPGERPGWVEVSLRLESGGHVESAAVKTPLQPSVRRCVEVGLGKARLAPFARGPVSVAYLLDLR